VPAAAVLPWLDDPCVPVRRWMLRALPRVGEPPPDVVRAVARWFDDPAVAADAHAALVALGPRAAAARAVLLEHLAGPDAQRRQRAVAALGAIGAAARDVVEPLVARVLREGDLWAAGGATALGEALARIDRPLATAHALRALERDAAGDREQLWASTQLLAALRGATAAELPRFLALLARPSRQARSNALHLLAALGHGALPALPEVLRVFGTRDDWNWTGALEVVRAIGPAAAPLALPVLEQRIGEVDERFRSMIVRDLDRLGTAAEPLLIRALGDPDPLFDRVAAALALARLERLSPPALAALAALMEDRAADAWRAAELVVGGSHWRSPAIRALLPRLLGHPEFHVRLQAARHLAAGFSEPLAAHHGFATVLAAEPVPPGRVLPAVLADANACAAFVRERAAHGDARVRAAAAELLAILPFGAASAAVAGTLALDEVPHVRAAACRSVRVVGRAGAAALPALVVASRDPVRDVREQALHAVRAVHGAPPLRAR
jgi:hypothetical protein